MASWQLLQTKPTTVSCSFPITAVPDWRLNIVGNITTIAERRVGKFEDSVITSATPEELSSARMGKSAYAKAVILNPGIYRLDVMVRDVESGAPGVKRIRFQVPSFFEGQTRIVFHLAGLET